MTNETSIVLDEQSAENIRKVLTAPKTRFPRAFRTFLIREGQRFIGDRRRAGRIRKRLQKRGWTDKFVNVVRYKFHEDKMGGMEHSLEGGLLYSQKRKPHEIMEGLREGGPITSGSKFLIVPAGTMYGQPRHMKKFRTMTRRKELRFVFSGGKIHYFKKNTNELLFVGLRRTRRRKPVRELEINKLWQREHPKAMTRLNKLVERELKKIEKRAA